MKLSCALVACNENTSYLSFWPLVKRAWWDIVGIPVIMVYVGDELPDMLKGDPAVIHFVPIRGWSTATQAQCIRLLYPSLFHCKGAVILSDMDMIPLNKEYFHSTIKDVNDDVFVSYRDKLKDQILMCYVAAVPDTWRSLFQVKSLEDIYAKFHEWSEVYPSDGKHGGLGWCTDQILLYNHVEKFRTHSPSRILYVPDPSLYECPRRDRIDRLNFHYYIQNHFYKDFISSKCCIDSHMPPYSTYSTELINILNYTSTLYGQHNNSQYH